jgi:hypothetical protein
MNEIKPGKYQARLKDYWIGKTSAGLPQAELLFEFDVDDELKELIWFGSFKEKAKPHTIKALLHCGLKGNDLSTLADGLEGHALELGKEVMITVAKETDDKGNPRLRISWVNPLGGGNFRDRMSRGEVIKSLSLLKGEVLAIRRETGIQEDLKNFQKTGRKSSTTDDVGF